MIDNQSSRKSSFGYANWTNTTLCRIEIQGWSSIWYHKQTLDSTTSVQRSAIYFVSRRPFNWIDSIGAQKSRFNQASPTGLWIFKTKTTEKTLRLWNRRKYRNSTTRHPNLGRIPITGRVREPGSVDDALVEWIDFSHLRTRIDRLWEGTYTFRYSCWSGGGSLSICGVDGQWNACYWQNRRSWRIIRLRSELFGKFGNCCHQSFSEAELIIWFLIMESGRLLYGRQNKNWLTKEIQRGILVLCKILDSGSALECRIFVFGVIIWWRWAWIRW